MVQELPPLKALVAFEAAGRHESFKRAAAELFLTPAAISQQVRKLEHWLGVTLFERQTRKLQLTAAGQRFHRRIAPALAEISEAGRDLRQSRSRSVRLSLSPTLAAKWLAPRMADFMLQHPGVDVHINATNHTVNFAREEVDLAIRYFDGHDPALEKVRLANDEVMLLCAPAYAERVGLKQPEDLVRSTLLHVSLYQRWDEWLQRYAHLKGDAQHQISGLHFDQALLGIEAARLGQGVVLANALMCEAELNSGALIEPFPSRRLTARRAYYLVHPKIQPLSQGAALLKGWLIRCFSGDSSACS